MKERPILMSAPMVRAILAGTKTQTRRILKTQPLEILQPHNKTARALGSVTRVLDGKRTWFALKSRNPNRGDAFYCRYGEAGDRLWVRETCDYCGGDEYLPVGERKVEYRADGDEKRPAPYNGKWCPSILMPRWCSRITIALTDVRVERLQDISEADAIAEGLVRSDHDHGTYWGIAHADVWERDPRKTYRRLWESINGEGSWALNPWVWVLTFRRA